ncbi:MAG TPA: hypothetical protein DIT64_09990 [Verrucomicrobiales bacterium]|nr:hypothetical protein [Verrucomicrobiales bacterium]HCN77287.1 hypothetical protein [Verrucomicrobiales bacterium]HRJ07856.1 hypothetical protein [Prosthecobacter sp.]HRK15409.1 hypothetical protein [Prosthecobacter sp.]
MLSRSELARLIDGPALDREIRRLGKMGGGWIHAASVPAVLALAKGFDVVFEELKMAPELAKGMASCIDVT